MKNIEKENKPAAGKRNNERSGRTHSDKKAPGKRGAELFRNGSEPDEYRNPITDQQDYRLRASKPGTLNQGSRGTQSKEAKLSHDSSKANSVQAEMRIRSRNDERSR